MSPAADRLVPAEAGGPVARARRLGVRALLVAVAVGAAGLLPTAVAAAGEGTGTTVVGELVQTWAESGPEEDRADHGDGEQALSWIETAAGQAVRVATPDVAGMPVGATVSVTIGAPVPDAATDAGYEAAHDVLASRVVTAAPATAAAPARALTNEVTVAMVAPAGATRDDVPLSRVVAAVDGPVADFWAEQTNGAISVGVTASHDWLTTRAGCSDPTALWDEVARAVGFAPGPGKHLMLYVSTAPQDLAGCSYALAQVGNEPRTGGRLYVRDAIPSIIAHELGHNFGLGHSSGRQCDAAVETGSCRTEAYRDLYDVMGASWAEVGSLTAPQAARLGVLPEAAQRSRSARDGDGAVVLAPLSGRTGTRALRLTDADGADYWLEYRAAAGRDAWLSSSANLYGLETGVLLRRADADGLPDTAFLLDGSPSAAAGWEADWQVALPVGVPVPVSGGDFTVTVRNQTAGSATLDIAVSATSAPVTVDGGTGPAEDVLPARSVQAAGPAGSTAAVQGAAGADRVPADRPQAAPAPVDRAAAGAGPAAPPAVPLASAAATSDRSTVPVALALALTAGAVLGGASVLVARRLRRRTGGLPG